VGDTAWKCDENIIILEHRWPVLSQTRHLSKISKISEFSLLRDLRPVGEIAVKCAQLEHTHLIMYGWFFTKSSSKQFLS
jgi:hypothetical protein